MKIAIIGTNGFLSTAIAKYAMEKGWTLDMYGLDKPTQHSCAQFYPIDLVSGVLNVDKLCDADIIVYAVGAGIQSNLNESADLIYALNVNAPVRICNALKRADYKGVFITFGSYFELGETELIIPAKEDDIIYAIAPAPTDYVVSKRMLTRFVSSYKHEYTHWHFILPTIYGPGENPKRLIPYTINAIRNEEELHFTSGEQVRQYLYVGDVAVAIEKAHDSQLVSGVYNLAGKETLSVRQLVLQILRVMDMEIPDECFGSASRTDVSMKSLVLDGHKIKNQIGFEPKTQISQIIDKY